MNFLSHLFAGTLPSQGPHFVNTPPSTTMPARGAAGSIGASGVNCKKILVIGYLCIGGALLIRALAGNVGGADILILGCGAGAVLLAIIVLKKRTSGASAALAVLLLLLSALPLLIVFHLSPTGKSGTLFNRSNNGWHGHIADKQVVQPQTDSHAIGSAATPSSATASAKSRTAQADEAGNHLSEALHKLYGKPRLYEVRNQYVRTVDGETTYCFDIAVEYWNDGTLLGQIVPLSLVKRGTLWYYFQTPNQTSEPLREDIKSSERAVWILSAQEEKQETAKAEKRQRELEYYQQLQKKAQEATQRRAQALGILPPDR